MILQIRVYLVTVLYFFGLLFMILFPPRNFVQSGAKVRTVRSVEGQLSYTEYVSHEKLLSVAKRMANEDPEVVQMVQLSPNTAKNRSIISLELRSDRNSKKPGILIIGELDAMCWGAPNAILELAEKLLYDTFYQTPFFNDYDWDYYRLPPRTSLTWWQTVSLTLSTPAGVVDHSDPEYIIVCPQHQLKRWQMTTCVWLSALTCGRQESKRYVIPMANPDGLNFTQSIHLRPEIDANLWSRNLTVMRISRPTEWHKNLDNAEENTVCYGTNINRNFAYHWQDDVTETPDRCSQSYPGERPFSTAEAQAIRSYVDRLGSTIHLAIHLHASFVAKKEYILYPWRYSLRQPSNYRTLQAIGEYAARQARLPDGRLYEVHQSSSDGRVAGTLSDYISGVVGTELVYLVKPYHQIFPNFTNLCFIETYIKKSISTVLSLVRGWRSSTKQNTLSFFGTDVDF